MLMFWLPRPVRFVLAVILLAAAIVFHMLLLEIAGATLVLYSGFQLLRTHRRDGIQR